MRTVVRNIRCRLMWEGGLLPSDVELLAGSCLGVYAGSHYLEAQIWIF